MVVLSHKNLDSLFQSLGNRYKALDDLFFSFKRSITTDLGSSPTYAFDVNQPQQVLVMSFSGATIKFTFCPHLDSKGTLCGKVLISRQSHNLGISVDFLESFIFDSNGTTDLIEQNSGEKIDISIQGTTIFYHYLCVALNKDPLVS